MRENGITTVYKVTREVEGDQCSFLTRGAHFTVYPVNEWKAPNVSGHKIFAFSSLKDARGFLMANRHGPEWVSRGVKMWRAEAKGVRPLYSIAGGSMDFDAFWRGELLDIRCLHFVAPGGTIGVDEIRLLEDVTLIGTAPAGE